MCDANGPGANFGGSCGWASAGRFHPAPSQIPPLPEHGIWWPCSLGKQLQLRRLNGDTAVHDGTARSDRPARRPTWDQIAAHSEMIVAFGGMAFKNFAIAAGGATHHVERGAMRAARERSFGTRQSAARRSAGRGRRRLDPRGAQSFCPSAQSLARSSPSDHPFFAATLGLICGRSGPRRNIPRHWLRIARTGSLITPVKSRIVY